MNAAKKITVVLADNHAVFRESLRCRIQVEEDTEVVGEAQDGQQAVALVRRYRPTVVVMETAMPQMNGLIATRRMLRETPETKVLILSAYSDMRQVQELIEQGAIGYLVKEASVQDLLKAIREAAKGNAYFSPSISKQLLEQMHQMFTHPAPTPLRRLGNQLTPREAEVLQLIAEGYSNSQIADALSISLSTVKHYRRALMKALKIHDVAGLTRYAIATGVIRVDSAPT